MAEKTNTKVKVVRRGHPVLAFLLGILFGIILLIAAVAGAIAFALFYKLDKISVNKDSDGNYIYINADPTDGGVENGIELIKKLVTMAQNAGSLTIGEIENLLPVTLNLTEVVYEALSDYTDVDTDKLRTTVFSELGTFVQDAVLDIRPASVLEFFGYGDSISDNKLMEIVLYGVEAEYAVFDGAECPVYYDTYVLSDGQYLREADGAAIDAAYAELLEETDGEYRLYFYGYGGDCFVTYRDEEDNFAFTAAEENAADYVYADFDSECAKLTGNYYYEGSEKVEITPVTLRTLADGSAFDALDSVKVVEFIESDEKGLTEKVIGDITVGDILKGDVDIDEKINSIKIADLVDVDPTNHIMTYVAYGISGIFSDGSGGYAGRYKLEDESYVTCYIESETVIAEDGISESQKITRAYYYDADANEVEISGTTVGEVSTQVDNLTEELALSDLIYISAPTETNNNAIMLFIAYSVTDVEAAEEGADYDFTGLYYAPDGSEAVPCYILTENGNVSSVYYYDGDEKKAADETKISSVSSQVNRLTKTLKIKEVLDISEEDRLLYALRNATIENLPQYVNHLAVNDLYADSVYSITSSETEDAKAVRYLAVEATELFIAEGYNANYIYYVLDGEGNYVLASTTGKLKEEEFDSYSGDLYTAGADGETYLIVFDETYVYYTLGTDGFTLVNEGTEEAGRVSSAQFETGVYYTYGSPNALWKLLLGVDEGDGVKKEKVYSVNNLTDMINNVTANTQHTTLRELDEAGIITFESKDDLEVTFCWTENGVLKSEKIGDMTLIEMINAVILVSKQTP